VTLRPSAAASGGPWRRAVDHLPRAPDYDRRASRAPAQATFVRAARRSLRSTTA
jgi:hypothetical protein